MKPFAILLAAALLTAPPTWAQQEPAANAGAGNGSVSAPAGPLYTPPTQAERFHTYLQHTFWVGSILEAGAHAGIDQARFQPSQWPEGAQGYAERFGSAFGGIVVRGTTEYALGDLFREDLRFLPCKPNCSTSKFKAALEDTFTARKGEDGHRAFSVARLVGPLSGGLVASTWLPDGFGHRNAVREVGLTYGLVFVRNLVRELARR